jgi:chromosome segregation ATPase
VNNNDTINGVVNNNDTINGVVNNNDTINGVVTSSSSTNPLEKSTIDVLNDNKDSANSSDSSTGNLFNEIPDPDTYLDKEELLDPIVQIEIKIEKIRRDLEIYLINDNSTEYNDRLRDELLKLKEELTDSLNSTVENLQDIDKEDTYEIKDSNTVDDVDIILSEVKENEDKISSLSKNKDSIEAQLEFVESELKILNATSEELVHNIDENIDNMGFVNGKSFSSDHEVKKLNESINEMKKKESVLWSKMMELIFDHKEKVD